MRALKYMKLDFIKGRKMNLLCSALALGVGLLAGSRLSNVYSYLMGLIYMMFFACVITAAAFAESTGKNMSVRSMFTLLLPGSTLQRVSGRFLYGIVEIGVLGVCYTIVTLVSGVADMSVSQTFLILFLAVSVTIVLTDMQYLLCYLTGSGINSAYLLNLLRLILPMAAYFAATSLLSVIEEEGIQYAWIMDAVVWLGKHPSVGAAGALLIAAVFTVIAVFIASAVCSRRDYA